MSVATGRARSRSTSSEKARMHRDWLDLVDTEGPFLAVPVAAKTWPQGMPSLRPEARRALTAARAEFEAAWYRWDAWRTQENGAPAVANAAEPSETERVREAQDAWFGAFADAAAWEIVEEGTTYTVAVPGAREMLEASAVVRTRGGDDVALVLVVDPCDSLRAAGAEAHARSPLDRMDELLRAHGVPVGVVTDGRWWGLVCAQPGLMTASGVWDVLAWADEPRTMDALVELASLDRLALLPEAQRLPQLFRESVTAAEEVTESLGGQVRQAVELLVQAFSQANAVAERSAGGAVLTVGGRPVEGREVYEGAVAVMMQVVFLLFAQERDLLPQGRLFTSSYGLAGVLEDLQVRVEREGADQLDGTSYTWHRLLATTEALHGGVTFEDVRLPGYGGSLFDPARFPWLRARTERGTLRLAVSDRVMLKVLEAVLVARIGANDVRQISFRDIDVEQIGYIYEGLLGYSAAYVGADLDAEDDAVVVGLRGKAGTEPEIPLAVLESLAVRAGWPTQVPDASAPPAKATASDLVDAVRAWCKENQPASLPDSAAAWTKALLGSWGTDEALRRINAATRREGVRARLVPFAGLVRDDLRGVPYVVEPGGLVVEETTARSSAGAHYTPRDLAEEVVKYALEPLVYAPGPHQTDDRTAWVLKSPEEILRLKVADIACGSGAFLVAAARYLAEKLVEARREAGLSARGGAGEGLEAIREVIAHCLYGADINAMAVEMCKLSLWLVSLDKHKPFSFVDDKILHGNSLLGLTSLRQLEELHIAPETVQDATRAMFARRSEQALTEVDVRGKLREAAVGRKELASEVDAGSMMRSPAAKQRQLQRVHAVTKDLRLIADGVIAAGLPLGGKPGKPLNEAYETLQAAVGRAFPSDGSAPDDTALRELIDRGLRRAGDSDETHWKPLHWFLELPDVFWSDDRPHGFDAVIGNPPFLGGQKLTGSFGDSYRDWLVQRLASGSRGSADLVAYFLLRVHSLLASHGTLGLIATNTLAQGDTRQIGLDRLDAEGFCITRSTQSKAWPSKSANLEYAAVWGTSAEVDQRISRLADGVAARRISTLLEAAGRVDGTAKSLEENAGVSFIGCYVLGKGFILEPDEAQEWIAQDPANAEVLFPYLNGEDLNSRPDCSPSRWVIDFYDRSEEQCHKYKLPWIRILHEVKSERLLNNRKSIRERWWQYAEKRPAMRKAIAGLDEVLVIARVSSVVMPMRVPTGTVYSDATVVFSDDSYALQAVLSSSLHTVWAIHYSSTMRTDVRYTPSDVFDTFPRPAPTPVIETMGQTLDEERREIMLRRQLGLTKLYNLVHDPELPDSADPDVARLRQIHMELDHAVMAAYGWSDVELSHGFHTYRKMTRWTVCPAARVEILDRLLEENHRRAAAEAAAAPPPAKKKTRARKAAAPQEPSLFDAPTTEDAP